MAKEKSAPRTPTASGDYYLRQRGKTFKVVQSDVYPAPSQDDQGNHEVTVHGPSSKEGCEARFALLKNAKLGSRLTLEGAR